MSEFVSKEFTDAVEKTQTTFKAWDAALEANADLHERMSKEETAVTMLSRRVSALEARAQGRYNGDDPMSGIPWGLLITGLVIVQLVPLLLDMVKACRSSSSSV